MTDDQLIQQFQSVEDNFNQALATNKVDEIANFISNDWVLLEPEFGIISKERFLNIIQRGDLSHTEMRKKVLWVKLHNNIALVTARGLNIGFYKNNPFNLELWVTNIYKKEGKNWICIMTQEAPMVCKNV